MPYHCDYEGTIHIDGKELSAIQYKALEQFFSDRHNKVDDINTPLDDYPSLYCDMELINTLNVTDGTKGYGIKVTSNCVYPEKWFIILINKFFKPNGQILNGIIEYSDMDDKGRIIIKDNVVTLKEYTDISYANDMLDYISEHYPDVYKEAETNCI